MIVYCVVLVLLVWLSFRYDINEKTAYKDTWYFIMLVVFILIAGLRWRVGIDTTRYLYSFYHYRPDLSTFAFADYPIGKDPLWVLLNAIVKSVGGRFYVVQLIHASIVNMLIFKYIKKHSENIFTCLFFYAITCYIMFNMEIMRGSLSIAICLFANDYILEKKWLRGYALYVLALMFHAQTILLFILPLLFSIKLDAKGVLVLIVAFIVGIFADSLIGNYVYILDNEDIEEKALGYAESEAFTEGFGIRSILLNFLPNIFYPIAALIILKKNDADNPILRLEPLLLFYVMFMLMKINFRITYRYVQYYSIIVNLFMSGFFVFLIRGDLLKGSVGVKYLLAILIFLPFFILRVHYYSKDFVYERYFPYTSVIDRKENPDREDLLYLLTGRGANENEY